MRTFDVISYLESRGLEVVFSGKNISSSGAWVGIQCPYCGDQSFHGGINLVSKSFSCFRCGPFEGSSLITLIQKLENCSKTRAWKIVREFQNLGSIYEQEEKERVSKVEFPFGMTKEFPQTYKDYLISRRFDPDYVIDKYDLYAGSHLGFFKFRVITPIILDNEIVNLVGRDIIGDSDEPYKALPAEKSRLTTKETLYNIDTVKNVMVIVEGILDAWRIGDGCVGTFGTKFTDHQIRLIKRAEVRDGFILFDSKKKDPNAERQAYKLAYTLLGIVKNIEVLDLDEGDPCDLSEDDVKHLRKELNL